MAAVLENTIVFFQGLYILVLACPSLLAFPQLLIRRWRFGKKRHSPRYWVGVSLHGANVLLLAACFGWLLYMGSQCHGGGCGSGIFIFLFMPIWWLLAIGGFVLTWRD